MKTIYILFFSLFLLTGSVSAQQGDCKIPSGDFENWDDFTALLTNLLPENSIFLPENVFFGIRAFTLAANPNIVQDLLDAGVPANKIGLAINGFERSDDPSNGMFAMTMKADTQLNITDFLLFDECGGKPESLRIDIKKEGSSQDTFFIFAYVFQDTDFPEDVNGDIDTSRINAFIETGIIVGNLQEGYNTLEIDFTCNDNVTSSPDSILIQFAILSGTDGKTMEYPTFTIDNVRTPGSSTSASDLELAGEVNLFPTATADYFTVESDRNIENILLFSTDGRLGKSIHTDGYQEQVDIQDLLPGEYFVQVKLDNKIKAFKILKLE